MEEKIQSKGSIREYEAFSQRILITKNVQVKLIQFRTENSKGSSSEQERKVNALALGADEGRD